MKEESLKSIKEAKNRMMNLAKQILSPITLILMVMEIKPNMKEAAKDAKKKPKSKNPFTRKD